jgi:hypothetical protein
MKFSETFYVGLYTSLMAFLLAIGRMWYKSKCKEVKVCCVKIVRDVNIEEEIDMKVESPRINNEQL